MLFIRHALFVFAVLLLNACGSDTSSSAPADSLSSSETGDSFSSGEQDAQSSSSFFSSSSREAAPQAAWPCNFAFGADWATTRQDSADYAGLDHIAVWVGDNADYNYPWEGEMLDVALRNRAMPVYYAYVIAEFGKENGLKDCDSGKPNHCMEGANLIRNNWKSDIMPRYQAYASGIRRQILKMYNPSVSAEREVNPDTLKTMWLIEPDFYQYSESSSIQDKQFDQAGGGIPDAEMGRLFQEIVDTIHAYLPAAQISIDISPWIKDLPGWYSHFDLSQVQYAHTSGGRTLANSTYIRSSEATWEEVHTALGKPIIADAGYGTSGTGLGHATEWDLPENINARIANGVVAITQMDAASDYPSRVKGIRPSLTAFSGCPVP